MKIILTSELGVYRGDFNAEETESATCLSSRK